MSGFVELSPSPLGKRASDLFHNVVGGNYISATNWVEAVSDAYVGARGALDSFRLHVDSANGALQLQKNTVAGTSFNDVGTYTTLLTLNNDGTGDNLLDFSVTAPHNVSTGVFKVVFSAAGHYSAKVFQSVEDDSKHGVRATEQLLVAAWDGVQGAAVAQLSAQSTVSINSGATTVDTAPVAAVASGTTVTINVAPTYSDSGSGTSSLKVLSVKSVSAAVSSA